jgi:hypothetical protein
MAMRTIWIELWTKVFDWSCDSFSDVFIDSLTGSHTARL